MKNIYTSFFIFINVNYIKNFTETKEEKNSKRVGIDKIVIQFEIPIYLLFCY